MKLITFTLLICLVPLAYSADESLIIGIVSTPSDFEKVYDPKIYSYMTAAYPQFMEKSGAKSIYIPWDLNEDELFKLLDGVNGVIFIGGDADYWETDSSTKKRKFTPFTNRIQLITTYIKSKNDNGNYLPLFGICQGMEVIIMSLTNDPYILDIYVDSKIHGPVQLVQTGVYSRMFRGVSDRLQHYMLDDGTLFYNHEYGFNLSSFDKHQKVEDTLRLTAIADDQKGKVFIAAMEAKDWPLYMVQFHPERVLRESKDKSFDQSSENVDFVMQLGKFFVRETKKSTQKFNDESEWSKYDTSQFKPITVETKSGGTFKILVADANGDIININKKSL